MVGLLFEIIAWIAGIGIILYAIISILGLILSIVRERRDYKIEEYKKLLQYVSEDYRAFKERNQDLSEDKCVLKFFSYKDNYLRAKKNKKEQEDRFNDMQRKPKIEMRVYSYKYENMIYEIFAPYAKKEDGEPIDNPKYRFGYINNDVVKKEIARILTLPASDADRLFDEFVQNRMLDVIEVRDKNGKWCKGGTCTMGPLLEYEWDIISKYDMNFSKWKVEQSKKR